MKSYVILDVILDYLNMEYPQMVATQIYDNVITSIAIDDIKTTSRVMTDKLTEFVGILPTLKVDYLSNETSTTLVKKRKKEEGKNRERGTDRPYDVEIIIKSESEKSYF